MRPHPGFLSPVLLPLAGTALILLAGCSVSDPTPTPLVSGAGTLPANAPAAVKEAFAAKTPVDPALVAANNAMGIALFQQLRTPGANAFISPTSIAQALAMTSNGAAGSTLLGMSQAMGTSALTSAQVNLDNAALLASLLTADGKVTVQIANSIWARNSILPGFLSTNQTYYGATTGDLSGAPGSVNAWVDQATQGLIPQILSPGMDCSTVSAMIVNATYFKGAWTTAFPTGDTAPGPFTRVDGSVATCPMMILTVTIPFAVTGQATLARLPYGNGRYAMVFALPQPGVTLDAFVASLGVDTWKVLDASTASSVPVMLPKFTATWGSRSLKGALSQMGMGLAFSDLADFSAMFPTSQKIDDILHQTKVEVDEAGTTAAGGTVVMMEPGAVMMQNTLFLNRPFLYGIQDTLTGELLFLGQMMDPTAG